MAVGFDASTEATFTTTSPFTFSHAPSGTPRGVKVDIVHGTVATVLITGAVTYGGVAMTFVGTRSRAAGEPGRVYSYYLGENIPTGTQTVSITHNGDAETKWVCVSTYTASADTEAGTGMTRTAADTNPSSLIFKQVSGMCSGVIYSGVDSVASITPTAGMTAIQDHDFGTFVARVDRETSPSTGSFAFGYTAASDDNAMVVINIIEKATGIRPLGGSAPQSTTSTTSFLVEPAGDVIDKNMYVFGISRDHTSGTALATCTDNSGVGSWALVSNDTDRKLNVWWKLGTSADIGSVITVAGCVGSSQGGVIVIAGASTTGDPTNNLTVETNASGNETHAAITPAAADSLIVFSVADYGNDTNPATSLNCTDPGSLEPEIFDRLSSGGSDCRIIVTARAQVGGPTTTGSLTWSQTDSTTKSVAFAVTQASPSGIGASTLADVTSAGTGSLGVNGTGASTLGNDTSAGSGTYTPPPITGTGSSTLTGVTSAGTGTYTPPAITGTGASTLAGATSAGSGVYTPPGITGTGSSTLGGVTSTGAGSFTDPITGTGTSTLTGVSSAGVGVLTFTGIGTSTLDDVASAGTGTFLDPITGTGASLLDGVVSSGSGVFAVVGEIGNVVCTTIGPECESVSIGPDGTPMTIGPLVECTV